MKQDPLVVIGVGQDGPSGMSQEALDHIGRAAVMAGGRRHLDFFPDWRGEKIVIDADLERLVDRLKEHMQQKKIVVLASGDPLFYGIGRALLAAFPKDDLLFLPQVSSIQLAFARIKETWNDACVVSLHGRRLAELLPALRRGDPKIAVFTDATNHPAAVAAFLTENGLGDMYTVWVCEDLGGPKERITRWSLREVREAHFLPLNLMILLRTADTPTAVSGPLPLLGVPDSAIRHRFEQRGQITKREIRLIALCYLELHPGDIFWDVGAGSGSVSVEAARLCRQLQVFAIERDSVACRQLVENFQTFDLPNITLLAGEAPEVLSKLPAPNAVFIGGSGGRLREILAAVMERLKPGGRLVTNCITLQNLSLAWQWLSEHELHPEVTSVQVARSRLLGQFDCLEPENPIFILRAKKP